MIASLRYIHRQSIRDRNDCINRQFIPQLTVISLLNSKIYFIHAYYSFVCKYFREVHGQNITWIRLI